jgi:hypothetical protein
MNMPFMVIRITFAISSYILCHSVASEILVFLWSVVWAISFGRDLFMGISPQQSAAGTVFEIAGWILWVGMVGSTIF